MSYNAKRPTPTPKHTNTDSFVVNLGAVVKVPEFDINQVRFSATPWVYYGDTNHFPDFLMKSVKKSPRHSRFINLRENLIKGAGVTYSDNVKAFLENLDEEGQTVEDLLEDWSGDLSRLETFACFVRYNKKKTQIIHVDYVDSSKVRPAKDLDENGKIHGYFVSADWSNINLNPATYWEKFNPNKITQTTQLFFYHKRANGQQFLPEISYASCLNWVEMEDELSKYGLNAVLNKFFGSGILQMKANMSDEDKMRFKRDVDNNFTGSGNGDKLMVIVSEEADTVKLTPVTTGDNTPWVKALTDMAEAAICTAHGGQPVLAGIQSQGSTLGSDGKLIKTSQELFFNNVIVHLQKPILNFFKRVFRFNGIADYDLKIETLNLVSEDVPDWFLQDYVRPEILATKYGFKAEDLISATPEPTPVPVVQPEAQPVGDDQTAVINPYPTNVG